MRTDECDCKDADYKIVNPNTLCRQIEPKDGYICTRPNGHEGAHHAHGTVSGECMAVWE